MKLTMLGTGNGLATECYNTCFVLENHAEYFLVDGGGGNGIFPKLKHAGIDWMKISRIFVTHKHIDHLLGILWMIRLICHHINQGDHGGNVEIYSHDEVISTLEQISEMLLPGNETRHIGSKLHLIAVEDREKKRILDHEIEFFDIRSTKDKQYGFVIHSFQEKLLACCGDEPIKSDVREVVSGSRWLLHEAFCLESEADIFKPYEKHHATVAAAGKMAEDLEVKNLVLYHTEDNNLENRKHLYLEEGRRYFHGNLYIPDDLDTIDI